MRTLAQTDGVPIGKLLDDAVHNAQFNHAKHIRSRSGKHLYPLLRESKLFPLAFDDSSLRFQFIQDLQKIFGNGPYCMRYPGGAGHRLSVQPDSMSAK